jgi:hypothetical protein
MGSSLCGLLVLGCSLLFVSFEVLSARAIAITEPTSTAVDSVIASRAASDCFPFGSARLNGLKKPKASLEDWWCAPDLQYGFMGCVPSSLPRIFQRVSNLLLTSFLRFSYPLEIDNCSDVSNSLPKMNKDFQRMKGQFGATMVRIYAPQCRDDTVWRNLLQAGIANNMYVL